MTGAQPPRLDARRADEFEAELFDRAARWLPGWSQDRVDPDADADPGASPDFGRALLRIAARFSSEVAERLDKVGRKQALGFLDWLGMKPQAARPARVPVSFRLADTAVDPVTALAPVKLQADVGGATLPFETEGDLCIVPGAIEAIVAIDPAGDAYFLPPPGLTRLDPLDPVPNQWRVKAFASGGQKVIQLEPGLGLAEGMTIAIGGQQYTVKAADDGLVTLDREPPAAGFDEGATVMLVTAFRPFDGEDKGGARNRQEHVVYLGDTDLLNMPAAGAIAIDGLGPLGADVEWQYWGKLGEDGEADWQTLGGGDAAQVLLTKQKGAVEEYEIGGVTARWLRARSLKSNQTLTTDAITLRINQLDQGTVPEAITLKKFDELLRPDVFVNSTSTPPAQFYPLGREPKIFDTLYLGNAEAFSKPGATAWLLFSLADGAFEGVTGFDVVFGPSLLAGVDKSGALHVFSVDTGGILKREGGSKPLQPSQRDLGDPNAGDGAILLDSAAIPPAMWVEGTILRIAVAAHDQVWVCAFPAYLTPTAPSWTFWGTVGDAGIDAIEGLAVVSNGGSASIVALRDGKLYTAAQPQGATTHWAEMTLGGGFTTGEVVTRIVSVRTQFTAALPGTFLLVGAIAGAALGTVYAVDAAGVATSQLTGAVGAIAPFGSQLPVGQLTVAAVTRSGATTRLSAVRGGSVVTFTPTVALDAGTSIEGGLDGSGAFAIRVNAFDAAQAASRTLRWLPFDGGFDFPSADGPVAGAGPAPLASAGGFLYLAGPGVGTIFAEAVGRSYMGAVAAAAFASALRLANADPAITAQDVIADVGGATPALAVVAESPPTGGIGDGSGSVFYWLDRWLDLSTAQRTLKRFKAGVAGTTATPIAGGTQVQLAGDPGTAGWLLVRGSPAEPFELVEIVGPVGGDLTLVQVTPPLATAAATVTYWLPEAAGLSGRVHPSLQLNAMTNAWDIGLLNAAPIQFASPNQTSQRAIAVAPDPIVATHPGRIAFADPWPAPPVATRYALSSPAAPWIPAIADTASNPDLNWEYWNGTGWWMLATVADNTHGLRNSGVVSFSVPDDLRPTEWAGKTTHWIRARLTSGDYGQETVTLVSGQDSVTHQPTQTVKRTTEGVKPPYAMNVGVAYALDQPVAPKYLLTEDSGTLRDQSDANRTQGVAVEIFTPLSVALGRLDGLVPAALVESCGCPDAKAPIAADAQPADAVALSLSGSRALYLGLSSRLVGAPITVMFAVDRERDFEAFAPLRADALVAGRFVPLTTDDDARAFGESGIVSLTIAVEPTRAGLFGSDDLAWLRLTPASADDAWMPSLSGVYLNAAWARAAETMTRELVGASTGEPGLMLALARPPVLDGSLELRVRELLGEEERGKLLLVDPAAVVSDVENLPGDWVLWRQVPDTADCGPRERVYTLDEATGDIAFGDGRCGMIPPIGADAVVAFTYCRADPGDGEAVPANLLAARAELQLVSAIERVETVRAADNAAGGVPTDDADRVMRFAADRLRHRRRAVTAQDFESLARDWSPDAAQARCFTGGGRVRLVVVMRGDDPAPSRAEARELARQLLAAAPPALAAPDAFAIEGPRVRRLRIDLTLLVPDLDVSAGVVANAITRLVAHFDSATGGFGGTGYPLGASPGEDEIGGVLLDIDGLDGIVAIERFEIDAAGAVLAWPARLRTDELAMLTPGAVRAAIVQSVEGAA